MDEKTFIHYCEWAILIGYTFMVIGEIITLNTKLLIYCIYIGLIIGYVIYTRWFTL